MNRPLRIGLIAVAAAVIVLAGGVGVLIASFDPNTYKPDIIQAVKRATGRDLTLNGKISLKPSLWPTMHVDDVAFSNPPPFSSTQGFSRPQMATLQGLEVQLGLLPLLSGRFEIDRLVLINPDILLETDAAGRANWQMSPQINPAAPPGYQAPAKSGHAATAISIDAVSIQDGTVAYRDDTTGEVTTIGVPKLQAASSSPASPLNLTADAIYNGRGFHLIADTGSLIRLQDPAATSAWPVKLVLTVEDAKLTADGSMTQPLRGKGYILMVSGSVPDAAVLAPLLPGLALPKLHDVTFAAKIADTGGKVPEFSTLTLHVGGSDLSAQIPGLVLDKLDIDAAKADQPMKVDATAKLADAPLSIAGTFGSPASLMPGAAPAQFPVDATVQAGGGSASAKGNIANAAAMTGVDIAVAGQIPDLSVLSPLARRPLPALKTVAFQARLTDADGGFRNGLALHGLRLTSDDGDLSGEAAVGLKSRPSITADLKSTRINLDGLRTAFDHAGTSQTGASTQPPAEATPAPRRRDQRLFSEQPIPFDLLRVSDSSLHLAASDVRSNGVDYKSLDTQVALSGGKLSIDPLAADLPAGHLTGTLSVDATQTAPLLHLVLHAPGVAAKSLLAAIDQPPFASGTIEIDANLTGSGDSPHAIAASLDGSLGLAMTGGSIDNRLLGSLLGKVMDSLNALDLVGKGGSSEVRCFALRADARHGVAAVKPIALSSSLLTITGVGTVNLDTETLAMALRPTARIAGTGLVIPIAVSGRIRDPSVKVNDLGAAEANAGTIAGVVLGDATPLGIIGGLFGADRLFGGGSTDICGPALAMARGQPVPEAARSSQPSASNPAAFLKNLFR